MAKSATNTDPKRNTQVRKEVQTRCRSYEVVSIAFRYSARERSVQVLIGVEYDGHFEQDGKQLSTHHATGVVPFEAQPVAETQFVVGGRTASDGLIADEGPPYKAGQFVLFLRYSFGNNDAG